MARAQPKWPGLHTCVAMQGRMGECSDDVTTSALSLLQCLHSSTAQALHAQVQMIDRDPL